MADVTCADFGFELLPEGDMATAGVYMAEIDSINVSTGLADITFDSGTEAHPEIINEDVPFFYHCQRGSYAFGRPDWGFSAFSAGDEVIVIHFPSTDTTAATTHIIGHNDINGITLCDKNEYLYVKRGSWFYMFDVYAGTAVVLADFVNKTGSPAKPSSWPAATGTYATWVSYNFSTLTNAVNVPVTVQTDADTTFGSMIHYVISSSFGNIRYLCSGTQKVGDSDIDSGYKNDGYTFNYPIPTENYIEPVKYSDKLLENGIRKSSASSTPYYPWELEGNESLRFQEYSPMFESPHLYDTVNEESFIWRVSAEMSNLGTGMAWEDCDGNDENIFSWTAFAEMIVYDFWDSDEELSRIRADFFVSGSCNGAFGPYVYPNGGHYIYDYDTQQTGFQKAAGDYNYFFLVGLYVSVDGWDVDLNTGGSREGFDWMYTVPYEYINGTPDPLITEEGLVFAGIITRLADIDGYDFEAKETTLKEVIENKDQDLSTALGEETTDILGLDLASTAPTVTAEITAYKRLYDT